MRSPSAKIIAFRPGLQVVGETIRDLAKDYPEWVLRTVEDARYGELIAAIHPASNTMLAAHLDAVRMAGDLGIRQVTCPIVFVASCVSSGN